MRLPCRRRPTPSASRRTPAGALVALAGLFAMVLALAACGGGAADGARAGADQTGLTASELEGPSPSETAAPVPGEGGTTVEAAPTDAPPADAPPADAPAAAEGPGGPDAPVEQPDGGDGDPPADAAIPGDVSTLGGGLGPGPATVYVLGDSVTLGASATVPPALAGWDVTFDAVQNRRMDQGVAIVAARGGQMGRVLVVHLCTNWGGGDYQGAADRLLSHLSGVERVVWVTCTAWNGGVAEANAVIRGLPATHPHVVVADWDPVSGTGGYTYADGLHLRPEGAAALADLIATAVGPAPGGP